MIPNNNLSVLPWYTSIDQQNHRKSYAYGSIYPLFVPDTFLLPFQIMRPTNASTTISAVRLYNKWGTMIADLTTLMVDAGLQTIRFPALGYDVIVYPANFPLATDIREGIYYMMLSDGIRWYYSEMFTIVNDISGYLKIEWYDIENLVFDAGQIVYKNPNFKNILYLCTQLGKPDYPFEENGETRDGYFFPEKQISEKTYRFIFLAPEYLCDVIRFIRLSDYIFVTNHGQTYQCDTFLITPKWQTQGDLASVEVEFNTATVVKKIGRGIISQNNGDYNNDYNNDFNNN